MAGCERAQSLHVETDSVQMSVFPCNLHNSSIRTVNAAGARDCSADFRVTYSSSFRLPLKLKKDKLGVEIKNVTNTDHSVRKLRRYLIKLEHKSCIVCVRVSERRQYGL